MNKFLASFFLGITTAAAAAEPAAPVIVLDLETALRLAVADNLALRAGALEPAVALEELREARGLFDPVFGGSYQQSKRTNPEPVEAGAAPRTDLIVRSDDYEVGISGYLPTGATYQTGLSANNPRSFSSGGFSEDYYAFLGVTLTQPLLRNFGPRAALAQVRLARVNADGARWRYQQRVNDTLTGTAITFYRLALARGALDIAESSVARGEQLVRDNEMRESRGAMSTQDVLEARARAARRRESLFTGRQSVIAVENTLKRYLYSDLSTVSDRTIEPRVSPPLPPVPDELARWADAALSLRPDLQEARLSVEQRKITLRLQRSRHLPELNLVASYGYSGTGKTARESFDGVREADADTYSLSAEFSVPLSNRSASARRRAAEFELRRAELVLADFEQEVRRQLADALASIDAARQRVEATREARSLADRSLEAEEKRLKAGTSSTFLVLEQQENLSQAQLRELQAAADLAIAVAEFQRLAGRTVAAFGLDPELLSPPGLR